MKVRATSYEDVVSVLEDYDLTVIDATAQRLGMSLPLDRSTIAAWLEDAFRYGTVVSLKDGAGKLRAIARGDLPRFPGRLVDLSLWITPKASSAECAECVGAAADAIVRLIDCATIQLRVASGIPWIGELDALGFVKEGAYPENLYIDGVREDQYYLLRSVQGATDGSLPAVVQIPASYGAAPGSSGR